jgi:hypothetical protein
MARAAVAIPLADSSLNRCVDRTLRPLKNLCQIEHTHHRSIANFLVNLMGGIVAYCLMPNKPRLPIQDAPSPMTRALSRTEVDVANPYFHGTVFYPLPHTFTVRVPSVPYI